MQAFIFAWGVVPREYAAATDLPPLIPLPYWSTMLTSMFLHGGWGHLGGNMLFLWIFGDNIEHRLGHAALPGLLPGLRAGGEPGAHLLQQRLDRPGRRRLGRHQRRARRLPPDVPAQPRLCADVGRRRWRCPALFMLGLWILTQFINGVGSIAVTDETGGGGVAYMAHIGGFVAGLVLAPLFAMGRSSPSHARTATTTAGNNRRSHRSSLPPFALHRR